MEEEIARLHDRINKLELIIIQGGETIDKRIKKLEEAQKEFVKLRDLDREVTKAVKNAGKFK